MKKLSPYVKKRIAQIERERRGAKRSYRRKVKLVSFELKTRGFFLNMDLNPKDPIDMEIFNEANKLVLRRAKL